MHSFDTIVARATPAGKGAIAVIRVSGPGAFAMVDGLLSILFSIKKPITPTKITRSVEEACNFLN